MKMETLNQKVLWAHVLLVALIVIPAAQQYRVNLAHQNEQAAGRSIVRLQLENSALRLENAGFKQDAKEVR